MVECEKCLGWFHFDCVGVGDSIADRPWKCPDCEKGGKDATEGASKSVDGRSQISRVSNTSSTRAAKAALELQVLEEKRQLELRRIEEEKRQEEEEAELERKRREEERAFAKSQLDRNKARQETLRKLEEMYLEKKHKILSAQIDEAGSRRSGISSFPPTRTKEWVESLPSISGDENQEPVLKKKPPMNSTSLNKPPGRKPEFDISELHPVSSGQEVATPMPHQQDREDQIPPRRRTHTEAQLVARQYLPKDLPPFTGSPEEWPVFYSSYEIGNKECEFSNVENLLRLQRSLSGDALEAVRSSLLVPDMVPHLMETLRMLYGRPETLISSLQNTEHSSPKRGHLVAAGLEAHLSNQTLLQEFVEKLPSDIKYKWAEYIEAAPVVDLGLFGKFISGVIRKASAVTVYTAPGTNYKSSKAEENRSRGAGVKPKNCAHHSDYRSGEGPSEVNMTQRSGRVCSVCNEGNHWADKCDKFNNISVDERLKMVRIYGLCRSCLKAHSPWPCRRPKECTYEGCRIRHHPLLHFPSPQSPQNQPSLPPPSPQNHHRVNSSVIYRILPVTIYNQSKSVDTFALFDEASEVTMIESSLAQKLELKGFPDPLHLKWTGNLTRVEDNSQTVQVEISEKGKNMKYVLKNARTVDALELPVQSIDTKKLAANYQHLKGLPIQDYSLARPQILIGLENVHLATPLKVREGFQGQPIATKTRLGWCLYGGVVDSIENRYHNVLHSSYIKEDHFLHDLVKEYIMVDNLGVVGNIPTLESREDKQAREILESTSRRIPGGFETGLLWKNANAAFPDGFPMAVKRLQCFEKRIYKNPELERKVKAQIEDYLVKGYAHKTTAAEIKSANPNKTWYLPLGCVSNPKKPEKLRLIWDASAQVKDVSFNSMMLKGPDLLTPLPSVLYRFRARKIAICGDVKEMFHQIKIREEDRSAQRFLWRDNPSDPPCIYTMDVATFGSACSPCSAQFIKNLNAEEFKHLFPTATEAIIHGTYVDDFLDSRNTEEEIIRLVEEVKYVHSQGGFEIQNFVSNSTIVLNEIGEVNAPPSKDLGLLTSEKALSVLGIRWLPKLDIFTFTLNLPQLDTRLLNGMLRPTKRQVLSTVMSLYDPLGMLAAFVVHGKIIIQTLWKTGCKWDEPVDDSTFANWKRWTNLFSRLGEVRISRPYFGQGSPETCQPIQMHTFVDASEEAYACVIYFRYFDRGFPRCTLVGAKSKVAPVKPLSIPRLELLAAVLGTRMANYIQENHQLSISQRFYWTDSSTVLHWIHADARKYHSYIACRIGEILTSTNLNEWRWVSSRDNVADEATKWGHGPCFEESSRWFHAPEFLWELESTWPEQKWQAVNVQEELRSSCFHHQTSKELLVDYTRFSKWERIHRTIAYVFRICTRKEDDQVIPLEYLKQEHLKKAELELIRIIQRETFHDEIAVLQKCRNGKRAGAVPIASPLYKLSAYIDEEEIVRMDSRIGAAPNLPIEAKCPIILAKNHRLTFLLVDFYHRRYLHRNHETVFNELRQQFYVPGLPGMMKYLTQKPQNQELEPGASNSVGNNTEIPHIAEKSPSAVHLYSLPSTSNVSSSSRTIDKFMLKTDTTKAVAASCLDPVVISSDTKLAKKRFEKTLTILTDTGRVSGSSADLAVRQYSGVIARGDKFDNYDRSKERLDHFWSRVLANAKCPEFRTQKKADTLQEKIVMLKS
ncbi:uncharacterized protein LOC129752921 [Uranotaenia lowii]|uniref:uncharacterized protein LOC129752921 n=1 Tax=Uranotaenia lowii TaxID=190385 RepID=UPI00247AB09D|nr:uncharacterized protein LOC129752921 [Uranotaenia lowii]